LDLDLDLDLDGELGLIFLGDAPIPGRRSRGGGENKCGNFADISVDGLSIVLAPIVVCRLSMPAFIFLNFWEFFIIYYNKKNIIYLFFDMEISSNLYIYEFF